MGPALCGLSDRHPDRCAARAVSWLRGEVESLMVVGWPIAIFRIIFGVMYLDMALQKAPWVASGGQRYGWLYGWLQQEIAHPTFGWYAA